MSRGVDCKSPGLKADPKRSRETGRSVDKELYKCKLTDEHKQTVAVVGASPRAAVESLRRAGFRCVAAARYVDLDLQELADKVVGLSNWRQAISCLPGRWGEPLIFVGPLENRAAVVRCLSRRFRFWGADADTLRAVRNPWRVARAVQDRVPCPALRPSSSPPEPDGSWLVKPLAGAGGVGVRLWTGGTVSYRHFFQRRVHGVSVSAVFVTDGTDAALVGLTQQLVGLPASSGPWLQLLRWPFLYVGSFGPLAIETGAAGSSSTNECEAGSPCDRDRSSDAPFGGSHPVAETPSSSERVIPIWSRHAVAAAGFPWTDRLPWSAFDQAERAGRALAAAFQLRGLFGCDFVWDGHRLWLVEVNPRYTASVEVFERAAGVALLRWHAWLCENRRLAKVLEELADPGRPFTQDSGSPLAPRSLAQSVLARCKRRVVKRVVYAAEPLVVAAELSGRLKSAHRANQFERRWLADVPPAGSRVGAGQPVCTVLVEGGTLQLCVDSLRDKLRTLQADARGLLV